MSAAGPEGPDPALSGRGGSSRSGIAPGGSAASGAPVRLEVALGERSYPIVVGAGLLAAAGRELALALGPAAEGRQVVVVTDDHLAASDHPRALAAGLAAAGIGCRTIVLPAGETSKSLAQLETLLDQLLAAGVDRRAIVIALGGGVIGDLAGFAAAVLLRGLDYVQIPTTLLAQVDSAVGGKTGINTPRGKNLVGAFHQPRLVLADLATLATLPPRELRAGYAEVVKYGLIDRPDFFFWLEAHGAAVLAGDLAAQQHAVLESCRAKAAIVALDERESGKRALLNLGHTFAHAIEATLGYGVLLHGEAVAIGLVQAFALSARLGLCPDEDVVRLRRHLDRHGLPVSLAGRVQEPPPPATLLAAMGSDKKAAAGRPRFVLARGIGGAMAGVEVEPADVLAVLAAS